MVSSVNRNNYYGNSNYGLYRNTSTTPTGQNQASKTPNYNNLWTNPFGKKDNESTSGSTGSNSDNTSNNSLNGKNEITFDKYYAEHKDDLQYRGLAEDKCIDKIKEAYAEYKNSQSNSSLNYFA